MSNEEIVKNIQEGKAVKQNMELLYNNLYRWIKIIVKPYTGIEPEEDLMQEAYFGLYEAVQKFEPDKGANFCTYATWWIRNAVQEYATKCSVLFYMPKNERFILIKYKKAVRELEQELFRTPTDAEVAQRLGVSVKKVSNYKGLIKPAICVDSPINEGEETTVSDTLKADFSLENDVIEDLYNEYEKTDLWAFVDDVTQEEESLVLREHFIKGLSMNKIAEKHNIPLSRVRRYHEAGLQRLNRSDNKRKLREKFESVESTKYHTGFKRFQYTGMSSVEYISMVDLALENKARNV